MIWLLILAVISIACYYYYMRYWIKKEYVLSYSYKIINLKETSIKSCKCYHFDNMSKIEGFDLDSVLVGEKSYFSL